MTGEEGITLPEVLITVVIMGLSFAVIVGGMATSITMSDIHRKQATAGVVLRDYAEAVEGAPYTSCARTYPPSGVTVPAGFSTKATGVVELNPLTGTVVSSCPASDPGLQLVSLAVSSTDGRATETIQVVKRDRGR